jgi:hypothetical protein
MLMDGARKQRIRQMNVQMLHADGWGTPAGPDHSPRGLGYVDIWIGYNLLRIGVSGCVQVLRQV